MELKSSENENREIGMEEIEELRICLQVLKRELNRVDLGF